jgi:5-methylcytosine-specific restriction endonuclease McrA
MTWAKLDDGFPDHPKTDHLGPLGKALWIDALCYCSRYLTDGHIAAERADKLAQAVVEDFRKKNANFLRLKMPPVMPHQFLIGLLCDGGWWARTKKGYRIHDYLKYNPSRVEVLSRRTFNARRQELFRDRDLRIAIRQRDGNRCRYCAVPINWNDRKGPTGATYDHVDPKGPNSLENLVVCCRACHSQKRGKSLKEFKPGLRLNLDTDLNRDLTRYKTPSRPVPSPNRRTEVDPNVGTTAAQPGGGTPQGLVDAWNEHGTRLRQMRRLTTARRDKALARLREFGLPVLVDAIRKLNDSPFATGNGSRGWVANFDWFVRAEEIPARILEGNYADETLGLYGKHTVHNVTAAQRALSIMKGEPDDEGGSGRLLGSPGQAGRGVPAEAAAAAEPAGGLRAGGKRPAARPGARGTGAAEEVDDVLPGDRGDPQGGRDR